MDETNQEFIRLLSGSGWNQSRAAKELHLDTGTISRYVNGETKPSLTVLKLFSELIGEPVRLKSMAHQPSDREDSRQLEQWELEVLQNLRAIPAVHRRKMTEAINSMLDSSVQLCKSISSEIQRQAEALATKKVAEELKRLSDSQAATDFPSPSKKPSKRTILPTDESKGEGPKH